MSFELLEDETKEHRGTTLYRVKYDDGVVGGWVESEDNIEDEGRVLGDAIVKGNAVVRGLVVVECRALVTGDALVECRARVTGDAVVKGHARIRGDAVVRGDARVKGQAVVEKNHKIVTGVVDASFARGEATREQLRRQLGVDAIDGEVLLWKKARSTGEDGIYESCFDSDFEYRVGEEAVCDDPDMSDASCSRGLHVGNPYYGYEGDTVLACRVDLDDIITVQEGKARVERLRVVDAVEQNSDDSEDEEEEKREER